MKHTLEVRQDAAEEPRPDEPRVTTSATPSCPTRDLWTRCSWMRNLARRLPSVRPEEAAEEACEEVRTPWS
ncbi:hypothetical protein PRIPAC_84658, partial [Pristionchus pacificus]|uniref:Uncharacterized protein n=1 Tax=Pristionchus pacificus TaxID=54126 RepID=A0A2A6BH27_PRIPA